MKNFEGIIYFKPGSSDNWGDPSKISHELLVKLDQLRLKTGRPIHVTSGYRPSGNTGDSQHKYGRAVDIMCPGLNLRVFLSLAEEVGFNGIGVYPHWRMSGIRSGGLHVDVRPNGPARWMGVQQGQGQVYIALNEDNLEKWGVT